MAITQGTKLSSNITAATTTGGIGQAPDLRRLYDFSDKVAELAPEESPFFVYLSKVAKVPTDDSLFRFLENRSKIDWTSRNFAISASSPSIGTIAANTNYTFWVDDSSSSVDWLVKGMVFTVSTVDSNAGYSQALVRVNDGPVDQGAYTSFQGRVIDLSNDGISGYNVVAEDDGCQVIGTAFGEGSGSPDAWSGEIEDDFGYTQIFKTAAEMSNTAIATRYRGYANEWERIWALKLREHKVDIERAMLFGQRARSGGVQYTEGLVGHIVKNSAPVTGTSDFTYTSGSPYYRSVSQDNLTYDRLLSDFEVLYDPARGASADKLVLASLPVITFFNKLGDGAFMDASLSYSNSVNQYNFDKRDGQFGHKIMTIETIHGAMHLVKEPLFRGISSGMMLFADMGKLSYRPLVGNGLNRDTHVITNVQSADEDLRKDMILTEAGLEISLPESHALYNVEGL